MHLPIQQYTAQGLGRWGRGAKVPASRGNNGGSVIKVLIKDGKCRRKGAHETVGGRKGNQSHLHMDFRIKGASD